MDELNLGPCVHGRDPMSRCEVCVEHGLIAGYQEQVAALKAERNELMARVAALEVGK